MKRFFIITAVCLLGGAPLRANDVGKAVNTVVNVVDIGLGLFGAKPKHRPARRVPARKVEVVPLPGKSGVFVPGYRDGAFVAPVIPPWKTAVVVTAPGAAPAVVVAPVPKSAPEALAPAKTPWSK